MQNTEPKNDRKINITSDFLAFKIGPHGWGPDWVINHF